MKISYLLFVTLFFEAFAVFSQTQVTFNVDMSAAEGFDPQTDTVYISGNFAGWPMPGTNPALKMLPGSDTSTVYTYSTGITGFDVLEYKYYIVKNDTFTWDNGEWGGNFPRRTYLLGDTVLNDVWADKPVDILFTLDMSNAGDFDPETDEVYVSGDFNNWTIPGALPAFKLSPDTSGYFDVTLRLYLRDYAFKFYWVDSGGQGWDNPEDEQQQRTVSINDTVTEYFFKWGEIAGVSRFEMQRFNVFPNPAASDIFIKSGIEKGKIEIYDLNGTLKKSCLLQHKNQRIDISGLESGLYLIVIYAGEKVLVGNFVKK